MMQAQSIPETEVPEKARRRRFSASEKLRILRLGEECKGPGALGAMLRREGIYAASYYHWKKAFLEKGEEGLMVLKRGRRGASPDARKEIERLKRSLAQAEKRAKRAEELLEFQKKISELIGVQLSENEKSR